MSPQTQLAIAVIPAYMAVWWFAWRATVGSKGLGGDGE